jgi:hypothetical protein
LVVICSAVSDVASLEIISAVASAAACIAERAETARL